MNIPDVKPGTPAAKAYAIGLICIGGGGICLLLAVAALLALAFGA